MKIVFLGDSITKGEIGSSYLDFIHKIFPEHKIINYGKNGEAVAGLKKRIDKIHIEKDSIVFLMTGINDVLSRTSSLFWFYKKLTLTPWSKDLEEFKENYGCLIGKIKKMTPNIVLISPTIIGEYENRWNHELMIISDYIKNKAKEQSFRFIDMNNMFMKLLKNKKHSRYILKSPISTVIDLVSDKEKKEMLSRIRNLYYTTDGVHLNSKGAKLVAKEIAKTIKKI